MRSYEPCLCGDPFCRSCFPGGPSPCPGDCGEAADERRDDGLCADCVAELAVSVDAALAAGWERVLPVDGARVALAHGALVARQGPADWGVASATRGVRRVPRARLASPDAWTALTSEAAS